MRWLCSLAVLASLGFPEPPAQKPAEPNQPALRDEILHCKDVDQKARFALIERLYEPAAFAHRMRLFIDRHGTPAMPELKFRKSRRRVDGKMMAVILDIKRMGAAESQMFTEILEGSARKPALQWSVLSMLFQYRQIRHMYCQDQFWEPAWAEMPVPVKEPEALVSLNVW